MLNLAICGGYGRMGKAIYETITEDTFNNKNFNIKYIIDVSDKKLYQNINYSNSLAKIIKDNNIDIVIDFTPPTSTIENLKTAIKNNLPFVSGTTGFTKEQLSEFNSLSGKGKLFYAPNFSIGINVMQKLLTKAAELLKEDYDIEIVEMHHGQKVDAPSGTAKKLHYTLMKSYPDYNTIYGREGETGKRPKKEIAIHTLRGGDVVGDHKVIFAGNGERIEIGHKAVSRKVFASGVLKACLFMSGVGKDGLYGMDDLI